MEHCDPGGRSAGRLVTPRKELSTSSESNCRLKHISNYSVIFPGAGLKPQTLLKLEFRFEKGGRAQTTTRTSEKQAHV